MRIGLLIYGSLDSLSGGYLYDRQLAQYFVDHGEQVEVVSLPWRNYGQHLVDNLSVSLLSRLRDLQADILLQDELNHPSLFYLNRRLKQSINYPIIAIVHHLRCSESRPRWQNWLYARVEKQYLESVDGFILNSRNTRQEVENLVGKIERSIVAYPAGDRLQPELPPGWIELRAGQEGPLRILFLGNVIPRKGLDNLLDALKLIARQDWQLSVVGSLQFDSRYVRKVKLRVQEYEMQSNINFFGTLDEDELKQVLLSSHLLVMPSYHEGFGIAYLEGMGFGLPAIASDAGGAGEIITHGENGFLVSPGDSAMLSEYIKRLISDRQLMIKLGGNARERFTRHPTWEDTSSRVHAFLEAVVGSENGQ